MHFRGFAIYRQNASQDAWGELLIRNRKESSRANSLPSLCNQESHGKWRLAERGHFRLKQKKMKHRKLREKKENPLMNHFSVSQHTSDNWFTLQMKKKLEDPVFKQLLIRKWVGGLVCVDAALQHRSHRRTSWFASSSRTTDKERDMSISHLTKLQHVVDRKVEPHLQGRAVHQAMPSDGAREYHIKSCRITSLRPKSNCRHLNDLESKPGLQTWRMDVIVLLVPGLDKWVRTGSG